MPLICPNCRRDLDFSKEPPRFCAFCGTRLPATDVTAAYEGHPIEDDTAVRPTSAPGIIGGYKLKRLLGAGGMGTVYEGESTESGQLVAVKLLSSQFTANPTSVERFRQEGKLASQITHPRCVFVLSADTDQGRPYIVMELMPGQTLKDLVDQKGPLSPQDAITKILDVVEGLQEAHRLGVIHRDVKPSNCFLLDDGRVKIGDFGLSKSLTHNQQLTQTGAFLGTVLYASPEQIRGHDVGYASDVYSVCATLFYLLCGRAPFEHESVTAALALVISEDAPPVSKFRPGVPVGLERVIVRGLTRDAAGRYQTLDELRDALVALIPSHLSFGGLWIRVAAYVLDEVLVRLFLILPLALVFGSDSFRNFAPLLVMPLYFTLLEGRYGASLGKRILRLRVCAVGTTDPPGFMNAGIRMLVFYLLVVVTLTQPRILLDKIDEDGLGMHIVSAGVPFLIGVLILIVPMRRSNDYRGLHEWLSGTCVMRLPSRPRVLRLVSRQPDRLAGLLKVLPPLPDAIGGYKIQAAGAPSANGERILLGEDVVLGRRVILHLTPATPEGDEQERARFQVSRPARLRVLGSGTVLINDQVFDWVAYVAPTGVPLIDSIDPAHRLAWCQSRSIIEQLAEELATAEAEGTLPETLSVQQVWVEPNGHAQLLDFIVPAIDAPPRGPLPRSDERNAGLKLLAKVATLTLEGQARDPDAEPGSIRAAIPLHAEKRINPLVGDGNRYASVAAFRDSMRARMQEPDEVTSIHRFGQIGVMTGFLAIGLVVMFIATGLHDFVQWLTRWESAWASGWVITQYKTEEGKSTLARLEPELSKKMNDPKFRRKFEERFHSDANRAKELRDDLRRGPRAFARTVEEAGRDYEPEPHILTELIARTEKPPKSERGWLEDTPFLKSPRQQTLALVFVWPVLWTIGAYLLKGGPSMPLTGLALRRRDGKKPSRERYALRAWIVWFPVALLLAGSVLIPGFAILWWFALALVMGYALCAIMFPERPQHDRLLGLEVVPR